MTITDCIYDYQAQPIIRKQYPGAKFEDASDEIHRSRFSVTLEEERKEWFQFLLREGIAGLSLQLNLACHKMSGPANEDLRVALKQLQSEKGNSCQEYNVSASSGLAPSQPTAKESTVNLWTGNGMTSKGKRIPLGVFVSSRQNRYGVAFARALAMWPNDLQSSDQKNDPVEKVTVLAVR